MLWCDSKISSAMKRQSRDGLLLLTDYYNRLPDNQILSVALFEVFIHYITIKQYGCICKMWGKSGSGFQSFKKYKIVLHITGFSDDDVIKWKHFPGYWPCVCRIHRSPVDFPHKRQWRSAPEQTVGWANNRIAGDSRRHRVHDVTVMCKCVLCQLVM